MVAAGHQIQNTASFVQERMTQDEERKALVSSTEIRAKYARRLDEAALSGADTGALKQEMLNELTKVGQDFQTVRGASKLDQYVAGTEAMYDQQANAINVQRAWSKAKLDGAAFVRDASAIIQSNPAYLQVAEANVSDFLATFPGITPERRAELADDLKKNLNMAGAISATRLDPAGAKKRLEAGEWDLTPQQREVALSKADTEIRAARAEKEHARAEQDRQRRDADQAARDRHFKTLIDGGFSRRAVMDDPNLMPASREHLILMAEARSKELAGREKQSDAGTKRALWMAINAPDGDARKIYNSDPIFKAVEAGLLNTTDANQLNNLVSGQKDENGRAFQSRIRERMIILGRALNESPEYKNQPDLSSAIQNSLITQIERKASELRQQNKSPEGLLDESSKDYFFKPGVLKSTAEAVKKSQLDMAMAGATRVTSVAELLAVQDGERFIDASGTPKTMTPAVRAKYGKSAPKPASGPTVSGNISDVTAP